VHTPRRAPGFRAGPIVLFGLTVLAAPRAALGWAEHEHIDIGRHVVERLAPAERDIFEKAWSLVRSQLHMESFLCKSGAAAYGDFGDAGLEPRRCVGFPALPMLAGDHACSPLHLSKDVSSEWVLDVIDVSHDTRLGMDALSTKKMSLDEWERSRMDRRRELDIDLQTVDEYYLDRAAGNRSHFVLMRTTSGESLESYVERALQAGERPNATAMYVYYHVAALQYGLSAAQSLSDEERADYTWSALTTEAFALHFLQDSSSAGHFVGAPDDDAIRMGTHDFYSRHGIGATTWGGEAYVAHGDAFLLNPDLAFASQAGRESLGQVLHALRGLEPVAGTPSLDALRRIEIDHTYDPCADQALPESMEDLIVLKVALAPLKYVPRPALRSPPPASFRTEYGLFVPFMTSLGGNFHSYAGTLEANELPPGASVDVNRFAWGGQLRGSLGLGVASDGVFSNYHDGLFFLAPSGAIDLSEAALPAYGLGFTARVPYAYFPGDLLLALPFYGTTAGRKIVRASLTGGLTFFGQRNVLFHAGPVRVQFDLGREVTFLWYWDSSRPRRALQYRQWDATIPVFSGRFARASEGRFASDMSGRLGVQLGNRFAPVDFHDPTIDEVDDFNGFYWGITASLEWMQRFYVFP
jgi:hypothetical protein